MGTWNVEATQSAGECSTAAPQRCHGHRLRMPLSKMSQFQSLRAQTERKTQTAQTLEPCVVREAILLPARMACLRCPRRARFQTTQPGLLCRKHPRDHRQSPRRQPLGGRSTTLPETKSREARNPPRISVLYPCRRSQPAVPHTVRATLSAHPRRCLRVGHLPPLRRNRSNRRNHLNRKWHLLRNRRASEVTHHKAAGGCHRVAAEGVRPHPKVVGRV